MDSTSMTPADFSALMGNHDGLCGANGGAWWLILLFLAVGGNGFGWNRNNGDYGQYATAASQQEILFGQRFADIGNRINDAYGALDNKIDRGFTSIGNGIADATFALNGAVTTEGRNLQMQLAECCCNNRLAIANLGAQMDQQTAAITGAIHAEGEATRGLIQTNEIQALRDKVSALEADNRMAGVVRYPMTYAYSAGQSPFCGCNHGCNGAI